MCRSTWPTAHRGPPLLGRPRRSGHAHEDRAHRGGRRSRRVRRLGPLRLRLRGLRQPAGGRGRDVPGGLVHPFRPDSACGLLHLERPQLGSLAQPSRQLRALRRGLCAPRRRRRAVAARLRRASTAAACRRCPCRGPAASGRAPAQGFEEHDRFRQPPFGDPFELPFCRQCLAWQPAALKLNFPTTTMSAGLCGTQDNTDVGWDFSGSPACTLCERPSCVLARPSCAPAWASQS
mmetsp:Transcript_32999/g.87801  ORF Transcript_32999/g.87801 Transcript_32999/m.87801 type:complete len:234 (+) Transcript_32999:1824-2525(+)